MSDRHSFENFLFVAAVPAELGRMLDRAGARALVDSWSKPGWPIVEISSHVSVTISGIGRANAAGATAFAIALTRRSFDAVINLGVAGALPSGALKLGDVILATESVFFEEGIHLEDRPADVKTLGFLLGHSDWADGNRMHPDSALNAWIESKLKGRDDLAPVVKTGPIATVASCSGADEPAREVEKRTGALAEAMEGAAVVATARRLGLPAAEVRVISNTCGNRSSQQWDLNLAFQILDRVARVIMA